MNKKIDKQVFKKEGEELQKFFHFRKRDFAIPSKKGKGSYNRRKNKRGDIEWKLWKIMIYK